MSIRFCSHCANPLQLGIINQQQRLHCNCGYVHWDNPLPIVAAIVEMDGVVILARNRNWPENMFGLISGFLEKGETAEAAVLREVHEELGLHGTAAHFIGHYPFFEMNQLILAFHVPAHGEITINDELAAIKRIPVQCLKPWRIGTGPAVRDWLARRLIAEKTEKGE